MSDDIRKHIHVGGVKLARTGCSCCDPTSDSPDPVVVRLEREVECLKGFYAKLYGCVRAYCNADPQVRGEAYRDMEATLQYVDGYDAEYGWPSCYERKFREVKELREKLDEERRIRTDITKSMECNSASLFQEMRANVELRKQLDEARRCARHFHRDAVSHGMLGSDAAWETACPWLTVEAAQAAGGGE